MRMKKNLVISISYFNYLFALGGTDKFIVEQKEYYQNNGYDYIFLYSTNYLRDKFKLSRDNKWVVFINERHVGVFSKIQLVKVLKELTRNCCIKEYIINHLMNVPISDLDDIFFEKSTPISIYIHDYYTLCPHSGLINSNGEYCKKIRQDRECYCNGIHHESEDIFSEKFRDFLDKEKERISVYLPSRSAKKIWLLGYPDFEENCRILPHYNIVEWKNEKPIEIKKERISVAYVGNDKAHKGYQKWKKFVKQMIGSDSEIQLYYFGVCKEHLPNVTYVEIDYRDPEKKLTEQLKKYRINCVILWSLIPETYSYTYYESYSAGCFILTNQYSGNIAEQVSLNKNGMIVSDVNSLYDVIYKKDILKEKMELYFSAKRVVPIKFENNYIKIENLSKDAQQKILIANKHKIQLINYVLLEKLYQIVRKVKNGR